MSANQPLNGLVGESTIITGQTTASILGIVSGHDYQVVFSDTRYYKTGLPPAGSMIKTVVRRLPMQT
jgi:hypothetical protein